MLVSVFAFFTDRTTQNTVAIAGNIDLTWEDTSVASGSNNEFAIDDVWDNKSLVSDGNIINPGDYFDLSYTLGNAGSKSIDVRQKLVLTSSVPMTADAEEYQLTITGGNDTVTVTPDANESDEYTLVYNLSDIILDGSKETEDDAVTGAYDVQLDFSEAALNAFMDSTVTVNLYATAKQHRNTVESDFPAFTALAGVTNGEAAETIDGKVIEYIGESSTVSTVHNGTIPEGGTYYVNATSEFDNTYIGDYSLATTTNSSGDEFPETINDGDAYVYGNYEYRYGCTYDDYGNGNGVWLIRNTGSWYVKPIDGSAVDTSEILTEINGKTVVID